jgi:glucose/arabinose dehydrogenase
MRRRRKRRTRKSISFERLEPRKMMASFQITIAGQTNDEVVRVLVDNQHVQTIQNVGGDADARDFVTYSFQTQNNFPYNLKVRFVNDGVSGGEDRAVRVHSITRDGQKYLANSPDVFFGGITQPSTECQIGFNHGQLLACEGFFEFTFDEPRPIDGLAHQSTVDHRWSQVSFPALQNPVIIAGPPTSNDNSAGVAQLRDVTSSSFDLRFKEWNYLDFQHAEELVSWLAVEEGRYTTADGSLWEVGTFELSGNNKWDNIRFKDNFDSAPHLFLTIQTQNGAPVLARVRDVFRGSFNAALFEEQALLSTGHGVETVGYLAIQPAASSGAVNIGGNDLPYLFEQKDVGTTAENIAGFAVQLEEEQSGDFEVMHIPERVNALALGRRYFAQALHAKDLDPVALRQTDVENPLSLPAGYVFEEVAVDEEFRFTVSVDVDASGGQFLADARGFVWRVVNGQRQDTPFLDIRSQVSNVNFGAGQMTGFALDPDFVNNGHIYVLYTTTVNGSSFGRLTRFTRSATNPNVVDPTTARHLIGNTAATGLLASDFHALGDIEFGEDGSLLFSWGDSASNSRTDPAHYNSQKLNVAAGKVFRVNAATGRGLATNPFFNGNPDAIRSKVWALGVRNGFRFTVQPGTGSASLVHGNPGRILLGDVGRDRFEELNVIDRGDNLGWPYFEGTLPFRSGLQNQQLVSPAATFAHPTARSVTGGVFVEGNNFSSQHQGKYLIADYVLGWIDAFEVDAQGNVQQSTFASGIKGIVDMVHDPVSGDILIAGQGQGTVFGPNEGLSGLYRLRYTGTV